ncbi:MAG: hypothetical protein HY736_15650, partial [Verrucomicrobia bacterium]|nr:hypothetical protein [Verrucomicrobiota bacterium]
MKIRFPSATTAPAATLLIRLMVGGVFLSEGMQKFLFAAEVGAGCISWDARRALCTGDRGRPIPAFAMPAALAEIAWSFLMLISCPKFIPCMKTTHAATPVILSVGLLLLSFGGIARG